MWLGHPKKQPDAEIAPRCESFGTLPWSHRILAAKIREIKADREAFGLEPGCSFRGALTPLWRRYAGSVRCAEYMKTLTATHRDQTRHQIVRVNLLRSTSKVIETVVGARNADRLLEKRKQHLTAAEFARGDCYVVRSCSPLGSLRRLSLN